MWSCVLADLQYARLTSQHRHGDRSDNGTGREKACRHPFPPSYRRWESEKVINVGLRVV